MDIRKPIGQLFLLLGAILIVWGLIGGDAAKDAKGENLNLIWGAVIAVFGGVMYALAASAAKAESCGSGCGCAKSR